MPHEEPNYLAHAFKSQYNLIGLGTALGFAVLSGVAGTAAYAVDTAATAHTGSLPSAGPASCSTACFAAAPGSSSSARCWWASSFST